MLRAQMTSISLRGDRLAAVWHRVVLRRRIDACFQRKSSTRKLRLSLSSKPLGEASPTGDWRRLGLGQW